MTTFLEGERIRLRPLTVEDAAGRYLGWLNSGEVCAGNSHHVLPYTRERALEYIHHAATTDRELILAVETRDDGRHIGNIALGAIHPLYRTAELTILIGEREFWGKGYGLEAARLLLRHGFRAMNLQRVGCGTFSTNVGMQKLALALGMRQEGVRRRAAWKDGEYRDVVEYGVLREEFEELADA